MAPRILLVCGCNRVMNPVMVGPYHPGRGWEILWVCASDCVSPGTTQITTIIDASEDMTLTITPDGRVMELEKGGGAE